MAHLTQRLPWEMLADHFKFVHTNHRYQNRTNLYPRFKPDQGKHLNHFSKVFARLIDEFSSQERAKYPADLTVPSDNEPLLNIATKKRIWKTVERYKTAVPLHLNSSNADHYVLRSEECFLPHWLSSLNTITTSVWGTKDTEYIMHLLKTLIIYGEMEPLLRLASHTDAQRYIDASFLVGDHSWSNIQNHALMSYLCLNVLILKPELHDDTSRVQRLEQMKSNGETTPPKDEFDYRFTYAYQITLLGCNHDDDGSDVASYPHQQFFGALPHMYKYSMWSVNNCGLKNPKDLCQETYKDVYVPHLMDAAVVIDALGKKGLPTELTLQILKLADYTAGRKLPVPNDPFHPANRKELRHYLQYCWNTLIRTNILLKAAGTWIDWEYVVNDMIFMLFGVDYPRMSRLILESDYQGRKEYEVGAPRNRRTFI
ncbi:hypothetical protein B0J11DRAFT_334727 [Dendryphion nanum]|uniref:Uncharacterized protein n=1 Tax=Dendryphion nanum TaxID=256645 RepID=A0A9P9DN29_9PLEO|nr:hypothetical protein B0J11DRAFT_334727 [Dendryphion nanum]